MSDSGSEKTLSRHSIRMLTDPKYAERKRVRERDYAKNHPDKMKAKARRQYLARHGEICERHRAYYRKYYADHREEILEKRKTDEGRLYFREHIKKRRQTDKGFQLHSRISTQLWWALRRKEGLKRRARLESVLGYSIRDLEAHLEKKFKPGMTWEGFMAGDIHIDHKIPVTAFNFSSVRDADFKRCFSLSNLQPLWKQENLKKGGIISGPFQPMLRLEV